MSNRHKRIANKSYEEAGAFTTRSFSRHGLTRKALREKKYYNRIGKRADSEFAFSSQVV